jgi:hypothetical protein
MALETAKGLLAVWTDIAPEIEAEFNAWYDTEHIPERLAVPGFLSGLRYRAVEGEPKYLALYDLVDENVLKSDAYQKLLRPGTPWTRRVAAHFRNMSRCVYRQIFSHGNRPAAPAEFVLTVRIDVPPQHESEFNEWYNSDHLPALVAVPGVYCARRYVAIEGEPRYLALYEMREAAVRKSEAWKKAGDSDWTKRIRPHFRAVKAVVSQRIAHQA